MLVGRSENCASPAADFVLRCTALLGSASHLHRSHRHRLSCHESNVTASVTVADSGYAPLSWEMREVREVYEVWEV